jgi:hypothetical protein
MAQKERIALSPGYHAEAEATKGNLYEVYTTLGELHGYERIYVGSLMKSAVEAWKAVASTTNAEAGIKPDPA